MQQTIFWGNCEWDEENEDEIFSTSYEESAGNPEHKFVYKETMFMSGKKKGQSKKLVTLMLRKMFLFNKNKKITIVNIVANYNL